MVAMERTEVSTSYDEKQKHFFLWNYFWLFGKPYCMRLEESQLQKVACLREQEKVLKALS